MSATADISSGIPATHENSKDGIRGAADREGSSATAAEKGTGTYAREGTEKEARRARWRGVGVDVVRYYVEA